MNIPQRAIGARSETGTPNKYGVPAPEFIQHPFDPTSSADIVQHSLNVTGVAFKTGNFDLFALFFALPLRVETFGQAATLTCRSDLRTLFENARYQNELQGATERERVCITSAFREEDWIVCAYETRVLRGTQQARDTFPSYGEFRRNNGLWQISRSTHALEDDSTPFDALLTRGGRRLALDSDTS